MTRMSRFASDGAPSHRSGPVRTGVVALWSLSCIFGGQGCLYVEPAWQEPLNLPPDLIRVNPPEPTLTFEREVERISVIAADPEGDALTFLWQPPPFVVGTETETSVDGIYTWSVDIPYTPEVDGQVLAVTIVDQDPLQRGEVTLEWQVVVP